MRYSLFHVEREKGKPLQTQIREMLVSAILAGQLAPKAPVPSTRAMAKRLSVSRNTVMLAYQALTTDGFLVARERSGFYVSEDVIISTLEQQAAEQEPPPEGTPVDWAAKLRLKPSAQSNIIKPQNWHDYPYPFLYGQVDANLFPIGAWRDCMRQSMSLKWLDAWTDDRFTADDPMLVDQVRQRILTRRGVMAKPEEILITMGAQNALFMLAHLLIRENTPVAVEDPGYPDIRNMFALRTKDLRTVPLDGDGIDITKLGDTELVFVTPSHQYPTGETMSLAKRRALLDWANENDGLIIEDDYEYETNYRGEPTPALKSLDGAGRVLHVGSLSKSMMPGLRMGFVVGPAPLISELRAMRRLMLRHPPGNNQRVVALFLSLGGHDALINRLHRAYRKRWETMSVALADSFPGWSQVPIFGGTSFWVAGPPELDARALAERAKQDGVLIEPGDVFFANPEAHRNYFRLGFSSIADEKIEPGIKILSKSVAETLDSAQNSTIRAAE